MKYEKWDIKNSTVDIHSIFTRILVNPYCTQYLYVLYFCTYKSAGFLLYISVYKP